MTTATRTHVHEETFAASPQRVFDLLITPSAIRSWWCAASAIVIPEEGGTWAATWGDSEDAPDYVTAARLGVFDPPQRLRFVDYRYLARTGGPPFETNFETEFTVTPTDDGGATLRMAQHGFPAGPDGDAFLEACSKGWCDTFAGIRRYLGESP